MQSRPANPVEGMLGAPEDPELPDRGYLNLIDHGISPAIEMDHDWLSDTPCREQTS
jgi:hypothetical protein